VGFEIAYRREEEKFVCLEHPEGQQIMLCQRHGGSRRGRCSPRLGEGYVPDLF
jgi:hypothetical protein